MSDEQVPIGQALGGAAPPGEPAAQAPAPDPAGPGGPAGPAGVTGLPARIEVLERDGRVRQSQPVPAWPLAIGRAIDNDLVLDDPHVAPYHAVIEAGPGGAPRLRVLPGENGMRCGRRLLAGGAEPVPLDALAP